MRRLDQLCRLDRNILVIPSPGAVPGSDAELMQPLLGRLKPGRGFGFLGPSGGYRTWGGTALERK